MNIRTMHEGNWQTATFPASGVSGLTAAAWTGEVTTTLPASVGGVRYAAVGSSYNATVTDFAGLTRVRVAVRANNSASAGQRIPVALVLDGNDVGETLSDELVEGQPVAATITIDGNEIGEVNEVEVILYSISAPVAVSVTTIDGAA